MASERVGDEGAPGGRGEEALAEALQQISQGLLRVQEAARREAQQQLHAQMQAALEEHERRMQAALQEQERRLRDDFRQQMQQTLRDLERREPRSRELDERPRNTDHLCTGGVEERQKTEGRLLKLETAVGRALEDVFPRVNALLTRLEKPSPPEEPSPFIALPDQERRLKNDLQEHLQLLLRFLPEQEVHKQLDEAVKDGRVDDVVRLLEAGVALRIFECGLTPLAWAAKKGHRIFVELLLEKGALVNAAATGLTPLIVAASEGHRSVVELLLEHGADVNASFLRGAALAWAASEGHLAVVELLLARGADVHAKCQFGYTALHLAATCTRSGRCVARLVGAGADVECKDASLQTPLHWAAECDSAPAARQLLDAGASRAARDHAQKLPVDHARTDSMRRLLA